MDKKNLANAMRSGAESIRALRRANESMGERLDLVYSLVDIANGVRRPAPTIGHEECAAARLEKLAQELLQEPESFEFPTPKINISIIPPGLGPLHTFVAKFQSMAFEVEHAANQWLRADENTRPDFLKVFFQKLRALTIEASQYGLDKPQPPTV